MEAILDGTIPYENQERYLNIVLSETERLNKLTSGLLTLTTYDDKGTLLELSDFDINDVIRKIAATFEVLCDQKNLRLDLFFEEGVLKVSADLGKIQQVLYNLIDNAIKFSRPDSSIRIETTEMYNKVFVSVKDHGEGIARENLPKIWTRFYKNDPYAALDCNRTGACYHKGNHSKPWGTYQCRQHAGRRNRIYVFSAAFFRTGIKRAAQSRFSYDPQAESCVSVPGSARFRSFEPPFYFCPFWRKISLFRLPLISCQLSLQAHMVKMVLAQRFI